MKKVFFIFLVFAIILSCTKKKNNGMLPVDSYIYQLKEPVQPRIEDTTQIGPSSIFTSGDYSCTERKVSVGYAFNKQMLTNPQSDVIYPGSMLDGNSIITGEYKPLIFDRAAMKLSISLEAIDEKKSAEVQNPSLSEVREAISSILR